MSRPPREESDLYKCLGLDRGASQDEVRKAFLKLSRTHHPDKGGNPEDFKAISRAHEILMDDRKKQFYDMTGQVEGEGGSGPADMGNPFGGGGGFPFDIGSLFGMFGAGGPQGGMPNGPRVRRAKPSPKVHEIPLRIHDYYFGRTIQMKFERQKFCYGCKGTGCKSYTQCNSCQGRGFVEQVVMMGPGMQAMTRGPCGPCMGEGRRPGVSCSACNGKKFQSQEKVLDIRIEPGMRVGEVLVFPNECSDNHDYMEPGDVHIILQEADDDSEIRRDGIHFNTKIVLSLSESLLGTKKIVRGHPAHPDGLEIELPVGLTSGIVHSVEGKGMPRRQEGGFGNLQCLIEVRVSEEEKKKLVEQSAMLRAIFG